MSQWDEYNILPKRFIDLNKSVLDYSDLDAAKAQLESTSIKLKKLETDREKELTKESADNEKLATLEVKIEDVMEQVEKDKETVKYQEKRIADFDVTFQDKVYFDDTANKFPLGKLKWARKTDNLKSGGILSKRKVYGYVPVKIPDHGILPEPFDASNIDENEHVVYVDGLLCYVPYDKLAMKRLREIRKADGNLAEVLSTYEDRLKESGGQIDDETKEKFGLTR